MPLVERFFTQLQPEFDRLNDYPKPLLQFCGQSAIVVLGDPGMGKTTSFQKASEIEPNAELVTVRDFLALGVDRWKGKTLYLDGLDEQRGRSVDGRTALDRIRGKLDELERPPFRLSCRAADWYGGNDAERLAMVSPDGIVLVLRLEPLSDENIINIANEVLLSPEEFLPQAQRRGIDPLLRNPQSLKLIMELVQGGVWPDTRADLYQKACERLLVEINPEHKQDPADHFPIQSILNAAGYLCAVHLCGGTKGLGLFSQNSDDEYPYFEEFKGDQHAMATALRRRVFRSDGLGRVIPIHRTIAEFLTAHYLVHRFREGLPLKRILALLTGEDGGTLSEMRGVYAWLACLCEEEATTMLNRDPLGIVLYGDATKFSYSGKQLLIRSLREMARLNPGFRAENWSEEPFGALATKKLQPILALILRDPCEPAPFLFCMLDALKHGTPLPELGDDLLKIVSDPSRNGGVRRSALVAFLHVRPSDNQVLRTLLDDIHENRVLDDERELRGILLNELYPTTIRPHEIGRYLVQESEHHINAYTSFIARDLVRLTHPQELPLILTEVNAATMAGDSDRYLWKQFVGNLILQILVHHGETAPEAKVYDWLGKALNQYMHPVADQEESDAIKSWLSLHPTVVRALFQHWFSVAPFEHPILEYNDFWERLYNVKPPEGFSRWLLQLAERESDTTKSSFLFREAARMSTSSQWVDALTLEELWDFTEGKAPFRRVLEDELIWDIPQWRIKSAKRQKKVQLEREVRRATRLQQLLPQLDTIQSGQFSNALLFLANMYFGLFRDVDQDSLPEARLADETTDEIAAAAIQGFSAALQEPNIPTPGMISTLEAKGRKYNIGFPILAGMDTLANHSMPEVLSLPEATLQSALVFQYANPTGSQPEWVQEVIASRPKLAAEALAAYWRPPLAQRLSHISGLYDLTVEKMKPVVQSVSIDLLKDNANALEEHVKLLLRAACAHGEPVEVLNLVQKVLTEEATLSAENRTLWYAAGFALDFEKFKEPLAQHIGASENLGALLLSFICPSSGLDRDIHYPLSVNALASLIAMTGHIFHPNDLDASGWLGTHSRGEAAMSIRSLILRLGKELTIEATVRLGQLQADTKLMEWRDTIAYVLGDQVRERRELAFEYPSVAQVLDTLNQGPPANATDLQALVSSHLHSLRMILREGPTDGWKAMWNVDSNEKPETPRPENDCRDRLLELLRPKLMSGGVTAEREGDYAAHKRADIKVIKGPMNLPVEIKRHYNRDLWTAPSEQLQKRYIRDPGTSGRGIYLVFWFGISPGRGIPAPPKGIVCPKTPSELEAALIQTLPQADRELVEILVFNCGVPVDS